MNGSQRDELERIAGQIMEHVQEIQAEVISIVALVDQLSDRAASVSVNTANAQIFEDWPTNTAPKRCDAAIVELHVALSGYVGYFRGAL